MSDGVFQNGRRVPRWAGFLLAAVAVPFCALDVRAGCGDYVHITPSARTPAADASAPQAAPDTHALPLQHPGPCHGPECSRRPEPAPLVPVVPVSPPGDPAACVSLEPVPPATGGESLSADSLSADTVSKPFRLERPPRA